MINGVEFEFPKPEELKERDAKHLLRIKTESWVAALMANRKPDEIRESLDPNRPGVLGSTLHELQERAHERRLVLATAQVGNKRMPVGFASSQEVFESGLRPNVRGLLSANPLVRELVKITPVVGTTLMQKPALELEPVHVDPERHDDDWLLMELGLQALGPYDRYQQQIGFVPYMETEEVVNGEKKVHFVPEDTLQTRLMHTLGFEINPLATPRHDIFTLGGLADPLMLQPYVPNTLKSTR